MQRRQLYLAFAEALLAVGITNYARHGFAELPVASAMKILVAIKRVPAPEQRIRVGASAGRIDENDLTYAVNPFDAIALEEGLRIRERGPQATEILAVSIGKPGCEDQLRTALAMGADRALRVSAQESADPWGVACLLAAVVRNEQPSLVLMGKQAIDDDSNQASQFLAAMLDWPQATFASKIELDSGATPTTARIARETDSGIETLRVNLPAVVSVDLRLNEPRYASLPSIIKARKKEIEQVSSDALGVTLQPRIQVLYLETASSERPCVRVKDVPELVSRLRTEAKVI
jgi:electron transfer flavoprotein beta subunit